MIDSESRLRTGLMISQSEETKVELNQVNEKIKVWQDQVAALENRLAETENPHL